MRSNLNIVAAGLLVGLAGQANGQLLNPSFELAGPGGNDFFLNWLNFNAPVEADLSELILDGNVSAKMFGNFGGGPNTGVLFQTLGGVNAGDEYEVKANVGHVTGDLLEGENEAFIALIYITPDFGNTVDFQQVGLDASSGADTFFEVSTSAVAPFDATEIQILFGFDQKAPVADVRGPNGDPNPDGVIDGNDQDRGSAHWDLASVELLSTDNEIVFNGGSFEEIPPFANPYWGFKTFSAGFNLQRLDAVGAGITPFDGDFVASTFGQFNGEANDSGFFQDLAAEEGQEWEASLMFANVSADALEEGASASLTLIFVDANGDEIPGSATVMDIADHTTPTDMWMPATVTGTAPAGAARARLVYVFSQSADILPDMAQAQGALRVDAVNLQLAGGTPMWLCADANQDDAVTPTDFGAWLSNFNASNGQADANGDNAVTPTDFGAWLGAFNMGAAGPMCDFDLGI